MEKAETLFVNNRPVDCPICGCGTFHHRMVQLNTAGMTFLKLDWLNKSAHIYTCSECSHILWFADR